MSASNAAVAFGFGALLACVVGYTAWRALAARDPDAQGRLAVRQARRAARATTSKARHAVTGPSSRRLPRRAR